MKKIIYSLVIMIAAGSLFTSCVENTEPQGIKDLRLAKADYLDALSKLRAADAEKVKAEAALQQAYADVQKAIAAQHQAAAEATKLANEATALDNEQKAAEVAAAIDSIKAKAEKDAVTAEQALAQAQWDLEVALRKIVAESFTLTTDEEKVIKASADSLLSAQTAYNKKVKKLNKLNQQLWEAEYDHAAGYDTLRTDKRQLSENYQDSVVAYEEKIAEYKENIANLEAVKENPHAAQDFIDAYEEENKNAQEDSLAAWSAQNLYEVTKLVEANKAYAEKVEAFKNDSVGEAPVYLFATITEDDTVAVKYPLTNGKGLDAKFEAYVNTTIVADGKKAADKGIKVAKTGEKWNIEVGGNGYDKEDLDTAQAIVATIVEALNRDLVVVNDSTEAKGYKTLVEEAEAAKKAYETDRDTLSKGLSKYQPYIDSVAKVAILVQDTVDAKANFVEADSIYTKVAKVDSARKDAAQIVEVKKADTVYKAAVKDLFSAVDNYALIQDAAAAPGSTRKVTTSDSTKFVAAINAFGSAQAAFLGEQDSLTCWKGYDPETGDPKQYKEALSEISLANFRMGKDDKIPYRETEDGNPTTFADVLVKIGNTHISKTDVWSSTEEQWLAAVKNNLKGKSSATDSINAVKDNPAVKAAIEAFVASKKVAHEKDSVAKRFDSIFVASKNRCNSYTGHTTAQNAYLAIVARFWGKTAAVADTAAYKFTWTDKTFLEPENCVIFGSLPGLTGDDWILENNTIKVVLDGIYKTTDYSEGRAYINSCEIFKGTNDTEFKTALYKAQLADAAANYEFYEDQLKNINTQVAAIKDEVEAYNTEFAVADKAYKEALVALTGKGKQEVSKLAYANVDGAKGVWNLAGKQLEFANEVAPEYPGLVKAFLDCKKKAVETISENNAVIAKLNKVCEEWAKLEKPEYQGTTAEAIIGLLDDAIKDQEGNISDAKEQIAVFEKAIAMAEQGYDAYSIAVANLKQQIANAEEAVARAEAILKIRKAEYEAVIAQYGVNE